MIILVLFNTDDEDDYDDDECLQFGILFAGKFHCGLMMILVVMKCLFDAFP